MIIALVVKLLSGVHSTERPVNLHRESCCKTDCMHSLSSSKCSKWLQSLSPVPRDRRPGEGECFF